ncbi:MAG: hypothetical protein HYU53_13580 [Acidobacteria bacterium]|nr:hypothetical protein [Acidobacteriota bacterium]
MKQPRRPFLWLTAALALLVSALVFAQAPAKHVVVISIDGLPMDYILNRDEYGLEIPHLAIEADAKGKIVRWNACAQAFGGAASIVLRSKGDEGSAAKVKLLFARLAADPANGIALVFDEAEIGQRGGDTRAAVMLSAAGCTAMTRE